MDKLTYPIEVFFLLLPFIAIYVFLRKPTRKRMLHRRSVVVLVLGDIGRSPRMMYHSQSFAQHGFETFIIGYRGSEPTKSLRSLPHVHFLYLATLPGFISRAPRSLFPILGPLKVIFQTLVVLHALLVRLPYTPEFIIVQNPPSIPTLAIVQFVNRKQKSKLIIDWHNLGYSILAMKLGEQHRFVRIAKWFERTFGRVAYAHLFVTQAMRNHLTKEWHLEGRCAVLHDRPPAHFHSCSPSETHTLFCSFPALEPPLDFTFFPEFHLRDSTPFTRVTSSCTATGSFQASFPPKAVPILRPDRPALVVSSTSWTPDEDFGILLEALRIYERRAKVINAVGVEGGAEKGTTSSQEAPSRLPKVFVIVTGKGDLREKMMSQVIRLEQEERWEWVRCRSAWLSATDYPLLLGSADLGVSLHSSSSNLDLPMKIVDMFGCGLPVCALDFACLNELVKPDINGFVFDTPEQLANHFERLLTLFPDNSALERVGGSLKSYLDPTTYPHALRWQWGSWDENWSRIVRPLVVSDPATRELN